MRVTMHAERESTCSTSTSTAPSVTSCVWAGSSYQRQSAARCHRRRAALDNNAASSQQPPHLSNSRQRCRILTLPRPTTPRTISPSMTPPPSGRRPQRPSAGTARPAPCCATTASSRTTTCGSPSARSIPRTTASTCTARTGGARRPQSYTTRPSAESPCDTLRTASCSSRSASWRVRCVRLASAWATS